MPSKEPVDFALDNVAVDTENAQTDIDNVPTDEIEIVTNSKQTESVEIKQETAEEDPLEIEADDSEQTASLNTDTNDKSNSQKKVRLYDDVGSNSIKIPSLDDSHKSNSRKKVKWNNDKSNTQSHFNNDDFKIILGDL
eukprot:286025_1